MPAFSADDVYALHDLLLLDGSAGHDAAIVAVSRASRETDKYCSVVWALGPGSTRRPLTSPASNARGSRLSPDGKRLAFLSTSGGKGKQVHILPMAGGEAQPCGCLSDIPSAILGWTPDGSSLLLAMTVDWAEDDLDDVAAKQRPVVIRHLPYKLDGTGYTVGRRMHLCLLDIATEKLDTLVGGDCDVREAACSPDGRSIAYIRTQHGRQRHVDELHVHDRASRNARHLRPGLSSMLAIRWSPDGRTLAVGGAEQDRAVTAKDQRRVYAATGVKGTCRSS